MLTSGQKRQSTEEVGIPQWQLALPQRLDNELLPGIVFQEQITEEAVVRRKGHTGLLRKLMVGLPLEEIVERD
jgi:hypothetical protein